MSIREKLRNPTLQAGALHAVQGELSILHPAFPTILLIRLDSSDGSAESPGLDYSMVHTICAVIAGNSWDGYLTKADDIHGGEAAARGPRVPDDQIIPPGRYFFHVPSYPDGRYPVVPTFRAWEFPHENLPAPWNTLPLQARADEASSHFSTQVRNNNQSCRITELQVGVEVAHLVPRAEGDWFSRNGMGRYTRNNSIDAVTNAILLRADLHHVFDRKYFIIVPKAATPSADISILAHVLMTHELRVQFHNRRLHPLSYASPSLLFARFVWSLFPNLDEFLRINPSARVRVYNVDQSEVLPQEELAKQEYSFMKRSRSRAESGTRTSTTDTTDMPPPPLPSVREFCQKWLENSEGGWESGHVETWGIGEDIGQKSGGD